MKRTLLAIVLAILSAAHTARAEGPDEQYVRIYTMIQQADSLRESGQSASALRQYQDAREALQKFQTVHNDWNPKIVNFRIGYLERKIASLAGSAPAGTRSVPGVAPDALPSPVTQTAIPKGPDPSGKVAGLEGQVRQLEIDKSRLEAQLREALSVQPASADPRELVRAEERIQELLKENSLLQVAVEQERARAAKAGDIASLEQARKALEETGRKLKEQAEAADALRIERDFLKGRIDSLSADVRASAELRTENALLKRQIAEMSAQAAKPGVPGETAKLLQAARTELAALKSDNETLTLEKTALLHRLQQVSGPSADAAERIKRLETERDDLLRKLSAADRQADDRSARDAAARLDAMAEQLANLRARVEVFEARRVPYTQEELALFKQPSKKLASVEPVGGTKRVAQLPAGAGALIAGAQRAFVDRRFDEAEQKFQEVLRRDDRNVVILANLAAVQIEQDKLDEAGQNLARALAINSDDAFSLSLLGMLKLRQENYDEALDALSRAAKLDPQSAETQNYLGIVLSHNGQRGPAETALRKAIQLEPGYASAHNNLAVIYVTQKPPMVELARWHYQKALAGGHGRNADLERLFEEKAAAAAP